MKPPFFSLGFSQASRRRCPVFLEVPSSGFGYPLDGVSLPHPWKPLSAPHTLGLSPSELFSSPGVEKRSPIFPSALALSTQTFSAWIPCLSGFLPPDKPCLFLPPEGLVRAETSCSPGLSDLSGSPCVQPTKKASLFSRSPLVLGPRNPYEFRFPKPQGLSIEHLGSLPP
jgi:hypothetical protein